MCSVRADPSVSYFDIIPIIIGMPPHIIMAGIPIDIIEFMASQRCCIIGIIDGSIGIIFIIMPSFVISQDTLHCIGIIIPPIIGIIMGIMPGIIPFMPIMPFIIGIIGIIVGIGIGIDGIMLFMSELMAFIAFIGFIMGFMFIAFMAAHATPSHSNLRDHGEDPRWIPPLQRLSLCHVAATCS